MAAFHRGPDSDLLAQPGHKQTDRLRHRRTLHIMDPTGQETVGVVLFSPLSVSQCPLPHRRGHSESQAGREGRSSLDKALAKVGDF